jgi:predicted secreted Zn-dependent protease
LIEVDVRYVLPQLHPDSAAAADDVQEWERHTNALWRHEEGHAVRALRAGTELRDSLLQLRTPTCAELSSAISRATTKVLTRYRVLQSEYDERTQHGLRQGAVLRMPGSRAQLDTTFRDTLP